MHVQHLLNAMCHKSWAAGAWLYGYVGTICSFVILQRDDGVDSY